MKRTAAALGIWISIQIGSYLTAPAGAAGQESVRADKAPARADNRFTAPAGFHVERVVVPPDDDKTFSLVNCCFDDQARLLVSKENGPILLCSSTEKDGVLKDAKTYCEKVQNCQGMSWIRDALWLIGEGPRGIGLYRCRDTKNADQIDEISLVHAFNGVMRENGPHGVIQGPDGMIYCVLGNQTLIQDGVNQNKLAPNSPLKRWLPAGVSVEPGLRFRRGNTPFTLPRGGAIWRMDMDGKNLGLVACGFQNVFDAAFAPNGELFTSDSDPEPDEGLPWHRPVRTYHCPPGADFVWRDGPASTPGYCIDSLPPVAETGRGKACGVAFYDHIIYPKEYRGAYFIADKSAGTIYAVRLQRNGASFKSTVEPFCKGPAMSATDLCVGPDGAIYFVQKADKDQGGVYRIVYKDGKIPAVKDSSAAALADWPQPQAAWSQKNLTTALLPADTAAATKYVWEQFLNDAKLSSADRIRMTIAFQQLGHIPELAQIAPLLKDKDPEMRAHGVWLIGVNGLAKAAPDLVQALGDQDALVRRRACEALVRIEVEPPVAKLWPLLSEKDRFVRYAARVLLERIDPKKWAEKIWTEPKSYREINETANWNGVIALCHIGKAPAYAEEIFGRLHGDQTDPRQGAIDYPLYMLEWLRAIQLALVHCERRPIWTPYIVRQCEEIFPHGDARVDRELASLLCEFQREGRLKRPMQTRLLKVMTAKNVDRLQQIHYVHRMASLRDGWTPESAKAMTSWYDATRDWTGGENFAPMLESMYQECTNRFAVADKQALLERAEKTPFAATAFAKRLKVAVEPELLPALKDLASRLKTDSGIPGQAELSLAVSDAIAAGSR